MTSRISSFATVGSISEYLNAVEAIFKEWGLDTVQEKSRVWYRGQSALFELYPAVFRSDNGFQPNERMIHYFFSANYRNYRNQPRLLSTELLALMQHYGTPTRLLDWTESHLIALYFAIESEPTNPVVWVLDTAGLNSKTHCAINGVLLADNPLVTIRADMIGFDLDEPRHREKLNQLHSSYLGFHDDELTHPLAYYPVTSGNTRIIAQKGVFTIHGTSQDPIDNLHHAEEYLRLIEIEPDSIPKLKEALWRIGITPRTVYPDLYGLAQEVKSPYFRISMTDISIDKGDQSE